MWIKQNIDNIDEFVRINESSGNGIRITYAKNILDYLQLLVLFLKTINNPFGMAGTMFHDKIHQVYRIRFK